MPPAPADPGPAASDGPALDPDLLDTILYLSRAGETSELRAELEEASAQLSVSPASVLAAAIDPDTGNAALHMAAANGHDETLRYLLTVLDLSAARQQYPSPPQTSSGSSTAHGPPKRGHALINHANASHNTPLHWAALNGKLGCVQLLLAAGADIGAKNAVGHDPLFEAERAGHGEVVEVLLGREAGEVGDDKGEEGDGEVEVEGEGKGGDKTDLKGKEELGDAMVMDVDVSGG